MRVGWGVVMLSCTLVSAALGLGCGRSVPPRPARTTRLSLPIELLRVEDNGLRVLLVSDPKAAQVEVAMRYEVGDIDEPAGQEGVAHLAEHLMFLPVIGPGQETLYGRMEAASSSFDAYTKLETTTYVSRAAPDRLAELLRLEGLRLGVRCKTLTEAAFLRERDVIRNELRQRAAGRRVVEAVYTALYPATHLYHQKLPSNEATVGRISRAEACAFIDAHYSPDRAVLTVSGNIDARALEAALRQQLGRIARWPTVPRPRIAPLAWGLRKQLVLPVEEGAILVVWPLDRDPAVGARMRAVASLMDLQIDPQLDGSMQVIELGEARAPAIGFEIRPGKDQSFDGALEQVQNAALAMQVLIDPDDFQGARARAGHRLFERFEDTGERAALLAEHVASGRDPVQALGAELGALDRLTAEVAREVMVEHFAFDRATVLTLVPETRRKAIAVAGAAGPDRSAVLAPEIHRPGEPRIRADPAAAYTEAHHAPGRDPLAGVLQRTLASGMRVILMPLTSMPTVDIRLVFGAGTADEPERERGVSMFAAHGLRARRDDVGELHAFYVAGGAYDIDVSADHTTFAVRGLDMHVDLLLTGLERLVRNGWYPDTDRQKIMRRLAGAVGEDRVADLWRVALYGPGHPYVHADDWRRARFDQLDGAAVRRFRAAHLQPRAATLIIAGGFDAAIADRWIDYLFGDWAGGSASARPRETDRAETDRAEVQPLALARVDEGARQLEVSLALPAAGAGRAERVVVAQMIEAAVADVRGELGASYGLHAQLVESRLGSYIGVTGLIAVERAEEALALVRARLARLAERDAVTASLFVTARRAAMAHLAAPAADASALASLAEAAVDLGLPLDSDQRAAAAAGKLTLDRVAPALAGIDLARSAVFLGGPRDAVTRGFAVLGLTPRVIVP